MPYQIIFTDELYHHGIKGQKWGIRRFRKKNGDLTEAGKKRYNEGKTKKKKSLHRAMLEQRYIDAGMSKKDAEQAADKKIKIEKGVAIAAGATALTVTAIAVYKKVGKEYCDRTIKKGDTINTLAADPDRVKNSSGKYNDHFYTAINKKDKQKYRGLFGITRDPDTGKQVGKYNIQSTVLDDVKIASPQNAKKEFINVYKQNPSGYNQYFEKISKKYAHPTISSAERIINKAKTGQKLTDKQIGKLYNAYNVSLPFEGEYRPKELDDALFKALKKKGYSGVIDVNDLRYSKSLLAKSPTIIFDKSKLEIPEKEKIRRLTSKELAKNGTIETAKLALTAPQAKSLYVSGAVAAAVAAGDKYDDKVIKELSKKGGKKK